MDESEGGEDTTQDDGGSVREAKTKRAAEGRRCEPIGAWRMRRTLRAEVGEHRKVGAAASYRNGSTWDGKHSFSVSLLGTPEN